MVSIDQGIAWKQASKEFTGSFSGYEQELFFLRHPITSKYFDGAFLLGLDWTEDGRSVATADLNNDGQLDLVANTQQGIRLFYNPGIAPKNHWFRCAPGRIKDWNRFLGATLEIFDGVKRQKQIFLATQGFFTQNPMALHFGLGRETKTVEVTIRFSDGIARTHSAIPVDSNYAIDSEGALTSHTLPILQTPLVPFRPQIPDSFYASGTFQLFIFGSEAVCSPFPASFSIKIASTPLEGVQPFLDSGTTVPPVKNIVLLFNDRGDLWQKWFDVSRCDFLIPLLEPVFQPKSERVLSDAGAVARAIADGRYWNFSEALRLHENVAVQDPFNFYNGLKLLYLYQKLGKGEKFKELGEALIQRHPGEPELLKLGFGP